MKSLVAAIKQTIGSRLVVYVVLFSSVMMLFVTGLQLYFDYKSDLAVIDSRLQQIENVSLRTLAHGLWIADKKNMRFHLEGLAELPDMEYFEIRDKHVKWISIGQNNENNAIQRIYPLKYEYKGKEYNIGSLRVVASLSGVYQRLISRAWLVLVSNGIKTFIVSIFLLLVFHHLITRHINRITSFVESLNLDNLKTPLHLKYNQKSHYEREDEVNALVKGVNAMREALRLTAEKLKDREQHIALTLNCVGDAVIATDQFGKITQFNPIAANLIGIPVSNAIGKHLSVVFQLQDSASQQNFILSNDIRAYLAEISSLDQKLILFAQDLAKYHVSISASAIENHQKDVLGLILTFRDTTDEYNAQHLIEQSQQKLQFHHQNTPLGVIEFESNFKIKDWNTSAEKIFGFTKEEAINQTIEDLIMPNLSDNSMSAEYFWHQLTNSKQGRNKLIVSNRTAKNEQRWCEWHNTILTDNKGEMYGIACLVADITERKHSEAELEKYRLHLEDIVQERTAKLEASNQELDAFCSSVSHDLRSPLRSIEGFSQILADELDHTLSNEHQDYFVRIRKSAKKMGQLIHDLLELSRITRTELKKEQLDLSQLVLGTIRPLQEYEPDRNVIFSVQENISAYGDPRYIQIIFDNLLSNAWKYSANEITAKIEFGLMRKDNKNIYYIKDNGAGFNEKYSNKLYVAFQRLHNSSEFEGSGVGLATVHRIIVQHGGEIWAKSKLGEGATFFFTLE